MLRRLLIALCSLPLLALAADALVWQWASHRLETGFDAWLAARRAAGWAVGISGTPERGGWPLAATLQVSDLSLTGGDPDIPGDLEWMSGRTLLSVPLLDADKLRIEFAGPQRFRLASAPPVAYKADSFEVRLQLEPGVPLHQLEFSATGVRAGVGVGGSAPLAVTADRLGGRAEWILGAPEGEAAFSFRVSAQDVGLPMQRRWPLGPRIASLSVDAAIDGPVPRTPGLQQRATGWRDGGGAAELRGFSADWGPMALSGSATLALDQDLQPLGTGTARIGGYAETLDALASAGVLTHARALAAKAVLSLIASTPDDGSAPAVEVPLTLQDRVLSMRQVPLARLPDLVWPGQ
jgi:hypothetical protein